MTILLKSCAIGFIVSFMWICVDRLFGGHANTQVFLSAFIPAALGYLIASAGRPTT